MKFKLFWHRLGSPKWFYRMSGPWFAAFAGAAAVLLALGMIWGLAFAPPDYQQGDSFRIIYVHVPAALLAQSVYIVLGIAGVLLLVWRHEDGGTWCWKRWFRSACG